MEAMKPLLGFLSVREPTLIMLVRYAPQLLMVIWLLFGGLLRMEPIYTLKNLKELLSRHQYYVGTWMWSDFLSIMVLISALREDLMATNYAQQL